VGESGKNGENVPPPLQSFCAPRERQAASAREPARSTPGDRAKKMAFAQIPRLTKKWTCIFIGQYQPNLQKSANEPVFPFRSLGHETKNGGQVRGSRQVRSARRTKRDE
jgi:hypothetical protein